MVDRGDGCLIDGGDGWSIDRGDGWSIDGGDGWSIDRGDGWSIDGGDGWSIDGGDGWSIDGGDGWSINVGTSPMMDQLSKRRSTIVDHDRCPSLVDRWSIVGHVPLLHPPCMGRNRGSSMVHRRS